MTKMFLQRCREQCTENRDKDNKNKLKAGKEAMDMRGVIAVTGHNFLKKC